MRPPVACLKATPCWDAAAPGRSEGGLAVILTPWLFSHLLSGVEEHGVEAQPAQWGSCADAETWGLFDAWLAYRKRSIVVVGVLITSISLRKTRTTLARNHPATQQMKGFPERQLPAGPQADPAPAH